MLAGPVGGSEVYRLFLMYLDGGGMADAGDVAAALFDPQDAQEHERFAGI